MTNEDIRWWLKLSKDVILNENNDEEEEEGEEEEEESSGKKPTRQNVIDYLKENPNPSDDEFHDWAEGEGFNVHEAEAAVYALATEHVKMLDKE